MLLVASIVELFLVVCQVASILGATPCEQSPPTCPQFNTSAYVFSNCRYIYGQYVQIYSIGARGILDVDWGSHPRASPRLSVILWPERNSSKASGTLLLFEPKGQTVLFRNPKPNSDERLIMNSSSCTGFSKTTNELKEYQWILHEHRVFGYTENIYSLRSNVGNLTYCLGVNGSTKVTVEKRSNSNCFSKRFLFTLCKDKQIQSDYLYSDCWWNVPSWLKQSCV
ncbi:uncharacterized protein LOC134177431 [Corticium candelabrum]|uniref:uncharacterized protein LOC134177431 n=1 Tax=Corticium candelabrum TaxID=121492 RepID=UPI002E25D621|nr:uncharacterized protein LOC134177431 [Corticium candelabrum]